MICWEDAGQRWYVSISPCLISHEMNLFHDMGIAIIHQPQFPSQLVDALKWWFSIQIISDFLNLEAPTWNTTWPTVQTPKDGAWGASYQRSGFIPGSLVQMRQNLKQMERGCGCCLFLVVVLVVGCWWWWLDVGVVVLFVDPFSLIANYHYGSYWWFYHSPSSCITMYH